jgi:mannose-6-phosphate isomerase-like protein (cupin superfamily)
MKLITRQAAPPFTVGGTTITGYAAPSRGATEVSLWRIELSPGSSSPLHQMDVEEVFLVLDGEAVAVVDQTRSTIGAGDCLVLPARTPFTLTVGDTQPFLAVACMTAGGQATMLPDGATFVPPWAE